MTDTTHWAPSDAMAALERGEPHALTIFGIAWARSIWCAAVFDYVGQDRWLDVARAAAPPSGPLANAIPPDLLKDDGLPRREVFGTWPLPEITIDGRCPPGEEKVAVRPSWRRGGKTAAGRAWAEANGAKVLGKAISYIPESRVPGDFDFEGER